MAQEQIVISSEWGKVKAELVDNDATALAGADAAGHDRDARSSASGEDRRPSLAACPSPRQTGFSKGTLGLWSADHFVIYYTEGRVPQPGIIILGQVTGDVSIFDRPGPVTVRVELAPK